MAYAAMDIARYVVNYCIDIGKPVSNLKLQKILYYIQAAFLVEEGDRCFKEDLVSWRHGPVQEGVYHNFKKYGSRRITDAQTKYTDLEFGGDSVIKMVEKEFEPEKIKTEHRELIEEVVESYKDLGAWELVKKTHLEDPWINTGENKVISTKLIKEYFKKHRTEIYGQ